MSEREELLKQVAGLKEQIKILYERVRYLQMCSDSLDERVADLEEAWETGEMPATDSFLDDPDEDF